MILDFAQISFVFSESDGFFKNIPRDLNFQESKMNYSYIINASYAELSEFQEESLHLLEHSAGWSQINGQTQKAPGNLPELVTKMIRSN